MGSTLRNAAIYARVSTEMQSRSSIDDQVRKCRQWAELHDFQVLDCHIYRDEALSGVGYDRPSLKRVLDLAFSIDPPFTAILVDDTSRLSRATEDALTIFKRLNFAGVQLIAVSQGISSNDEQSETLVTVHGLVDSLYVRELAKKTHRGLEGTVLRGCHYGGACFGYKSVAAGEDGSKRLLVDKSEAHIVRRIFEMSAAGHSLKGIARKLNAEKVVGREQWCPTGIRSTLKNELYKGLVIWNRSRFVKVPGTNKRRRKMRDQSEWIQIERPELAVVPAELWDRVQARLNLHGAKPAEGRRRGLFARGFTSPYLFSGLLKCGECGANLIVGTGGGTHKHKKYVCANYFNRGTCGNDLYIRRDVLEERLLGRLQSELLRPEVIDYAVSEFGRQLRTHLLSLSGDLSELRRRKEKLDREIQRFVAAIAQGGQLEALVREVANREEELKVVSGKLLSASPGSIETRVDSIRRFVEKGITDLRTLLNRDVALAKAELQSHLSEVKMTPVEGKKEWNYIAEGNWSLLGTGPNAPVIGLAHSDGCGGQI
jgi:site-specific DNA recombinase